MKANVFECSNLAEALVVSKTISRLPQSATDLALCDAERTRSLANGQTVSERGQDGFVVGHRANIVAPARRRREQPQAALPQRGESPATAASVSSVSAPAMEPTVWDSPARPYAR